MKVMFGWCEVKLAIRAGMFIIIPFPSMSTDCLATNMWAVRFVTAEEEECVLLRQIRYHVKCAMV